MNRLLVVSLSLAATAAVAAAQSPLHSFHGTDPGSRFGHIVRNAGDNNADGRTDVAVGAPLHDLDAVDWDAGMVRIFSGANGSKLREYFGDHFQENAGWSLANAGDVNGDGRDDIVYAERDGRFRYPGAFHVYNAQGRRLWMLNGELAYDYTGNSLGNAGDVDGDGYSDVIVGEPGRDDAANNAGRVRVFSGKARTAIHTWFGDQSGDEFGAAVARAGDVDGDGWIDVVVGAPRADQPGRADCGMVRVLSGKTGAVLFTVYGDAAGDRLGSSVDGDADVDHDGRPDIVAGAPLAGGSDNGMVKVISGRTGAVLHSWSGANAGDQFGTAVALADIDGDRHADVVIGSPYVDGGAGADAGQVVIRSGADGAVLRTLDGPSAGAQFGWSVDDAGDVDADGYTDVIVGAPDDLVQGVATGSAFVYSFGGTAAPARSRYVGPGCPGSDGRLPRISIAGRAFLGDAYEALLHGAQPSVIVALNLGIAWNQALGAAAPGCTAYAYPLASVGGTTDVDGFARINPFGTLPNDPAFVGIELHHQWLCIDAPNNALGISMSNDAVLWVGQ